MGTYSFQDTQLAIVGPGGAFTIGSSEAVANEGITVAYVGDRNTMTSGAGTDVMHSLHAAHPGLITIRLLKTSPYNGLLSIMYELQQTSSALWGINTIVLNDGARGDIVTGAQCAFQKFPDNAYATEGNTLEWAFQVAQLYELLGLGTNSN